jgi:hypothetical protein
LFGSTASVRFQDNPRISEKFNCLFDFWPVLSTLEFLGINRVVQNLVQQRLNLAVIGNEFLDEFQTASVGHDEDLVRREEMWLNPAVGGWSREEGKEVSSGRDVKVFD